jgi:hypothetical protein
MLPFDVAPKEIVVGFLLGLLSSAIVGYVFYRVSQPKKRLSYSVEERNIVWTSGNNPALRITFNDKPVTELIRLVIYIWNSGSQPITKVDLETNDHLRLVFKGFDRTNTLQSGIGTQTRHANNAALDEDRISFDYLNPGDGVTLNLFVESVHVGKFSNFRGDATSPLLVEGEVVGMQSKPGYLRFSEIARRQDHMVPVIGNGLISLVGMVGLNFELTKFGSGMAIALVLIGVPGFVWSLSKLLGKPKLPKYLQTN